MDAEGVRTYFFGRGQTRTWHGAEKKISKAGNILRKNKPPSQKQRAFPGHQARHQTHTHTSSAGRSTRTNFRSQENFRRAFRPARSARRKSPPFARRMLPLAGGWTSQRWRTPLGHCKVRSGRREWTVRTALWAFLPITALGFGIRTGTIVHERQVSIMLLFDEIR
jgi:hypothetical protein